MGHTTPDGTAHYETGPLGDMGLTTLQQPMGMGMILTPSTWRWLPPPFFPGPSGHKIKSHILKVPNSVIILASQSTCNWPIKLLRKKRNWQLYPSKYGNPHSNCTEVEGSGLHPHFRNEEMEEEVRRLVHIGGTAAKNQSVPVFRPGLSVMQSLGGGSHLWVESPHPGVTPQYGGCGVHTGPR